MATFNKENKGHETKDYPLFFGEDLGLFDTVNIVYPELDDLYHKQMSQIWNEFEVDLTQDRMDMQRLPVDVTDLMVKTISWQHLADSVACKSIAGLLIPHCTNSELEGVLTAQAMFEIIHSRTYSHIIKQTFSDPNKMLEDTYDNVNVLIRSNQLVEAFDELERVNCGTVEDKKAALAKAFAALFALEGIAFMSSFAVTFAIVETDVFQGIGALVALICRDEVLHTRMDYTILDYLMRDSEWKATFEQEKANISKILCDVVQQELDWADYLFSEGREIVGLNAELLKEYTIYMAKGIFDALGVEFPYEEVKVSPLPYMEKYIDSSQMQSAAQEIQLTNYNIGAIENDTDGLDLDMEF